jgi:hypothetical protein
MNGTALAASPASQAERPREGWLRRLLVGFGFLFLLTVGVIAIVSLLVHFLPAQGPASAWKYAVQKLWPEITRPGRSCRAVKAA